jgi:enamine deaminase RidA (YjgF/YER057c/UK114 family)
MRRYIDTGFKKPAAPHAWAVASSNILYSVHVPIRKDGSIEDGDAEQQTEITFYDLQATLEAAGSSLKDVVLLQIFLTSLEHKPVVDDVYKRYFKEPYPVRACIAVLELPTPGTIIEVVATAHLSH